MNRIIFPELSYKITGICFKAHEKLGRFAREKQYADLLESLFKESQMPYGREYEISNLGQGIPKGNIVDFLIDGKILLDLKVKKFITKDDYAQMQRYLQGSRKELGLIVNFRNTYLKPKRVLNTKLYSENSDGNLENSDRFEILEHKADLKIRAFGKAKEEIFLNMLKGMSESQKPQIENGESVKREVRVKSLDLPALLVDFLNEALSLGQVNKETYFNIKFKKFSDNSSINSEQVELEAELFGKKVKRFGEDIKAATYHELDIREREEGSWEAIVLFDI